MASVANRPECCLTRRSNDSGMASRISSDVRPPAAPEEPVASLAPKLSSIPKSYAAFLADSSKRFPGLGSSGAWSGVRRLNRCRQHVVDLILLGCRDRHRGVDLAVARQ